MRSVLRAVGITFTLLVGGYLAFGLLFGGVQWLFQGLWHLAVGWASYLDRTVPRLTLNPTEVAVAGVALAVVAVGGHRVGRWLAPPLLGRPWRWGWTGRAVGLVLLLFVAGTAAVGIAHQSAWLARSPEPLTVSGGGIRGVAGRTTAQNSLKHMSIAAHAIADSTGRLPAPTFTADGRPLHSWHTFLLPYLEQDALYRRIDRTRPWADPANRPVVMTRVAVFEYRWPPVPDGAPAVTHFAPNSRLLDRPRRLPADFPLGTSNTVLAGEALTAPRPWADPLNGRDARRPLGTPGGFAGPAAGRVQVLLADGSVRAVTAAGWAAVMRDQPPGDD